MKRNIVIIIVLSVILAGGAIYVIQNNKSLKTTKPSLPTAATAESRNELRKIAIKQLATAIDGYIAEKGSFPIKLTTTPKAICSSITANCTKAKLVNLNFLSSNGLYIPSIPTDPVGVNSQYSTGFLIAKDPTTGKIIVSAPNAELGAVLSATTR